LANIVRYSALERSRPSSVKTTADTPTRYLSTTIRTAARRYRVDILQNIFAKSLREAKAALHL
jgi:hypothetical protein